MTTPPLAQSAPEPSFEALNCLWAYNRRGEALHEMRALLYSATAHGVKLSAECDSLALELAEARRERDSLRAKLEEAERERDADRAQLLGWLDTARAERDELRERADFLLAMTREAQDIAQQQIDERAKTLAAAAPAKPLSETCEWTLEDNPDDMIWHSACGEAWTFSEGGPAENNMRFCQGCGKALRQALGSKESGDGR